jgi:glycosyltransferase involved in cell wall biosynthesis
MSNNHYICFITNIGAHYRLPIFSHIEKNFDCSYYLGDKIKSPLKTFEYKVLDGYRGTLHNIFWGPFYWQKGSIRLINKNYQYYILDGEPFCLSSWCILLLAKLKGKKTICWSHGWYGRETGIKKVIKKTFFSLFSKLMLYNEYSINLMEGLGFDRKKMFCIANSLDSDKELFVRKNLHSTDIYAFHFKNTNPTIIYCGRIQKRKKLEMLVDCVKVLNLDNIKTNLVIVGKDIDGVNLQDYAKKQGVENQLWMYGPCYDDRKIGELFYNAAVCVSPGNIGLTAIHALSFGCPAITHGNFPHQMPEFEAIRPGLTGDFFEQNQLDDLVRKVKKWIQQTPSEREITRKKAFEEIDNKWNIHHQIDVLKQVIYG